MEHHKPWMMAKTIFFDVTNCDEDTVGSPDYLILCGMTGIKYLESVQTDLEVTFRGRATEQEDRLMLLDPAAISVMGVFTM